MLTLPENGAVSERWVAAVCDGVTHCAGGGSWAAETAVTGLRQYAEDIVGTSASARELEGVVQGIHQTVLAHNQKEARSCCTCLAVVFDGSECRWLSSGDSDLYLLRGGKIARLTEGSAATGGRLGERQDPPLITDWLELRPGDRLLLATDGVSPTQAADYADILARDEPPARLAEQLTDLARTQRDDATAVVIIIEPGGVDSAVSCTQPDPPSSLTGDRPPTAPTPTADAEASDGCLSRPAPTGEPGAGAQPAADSGSSSETGHVTAPARGQIRIAAWQLTLLALVPVALVALGFVGGFALRGWVASGTQPATGPLGEPAWLASVEQGSTLLHAPSTRHAVLWTPRGRLVQFSSSDSVPRGHMRPHVAVEDVGDASRRDVIYWDDKRGGLVHKCGDLREFVPLPEDGSPAGMSIDAGGNVWLLFGDRLWLVPRQGMPEKQGVPHVHSRTSP